MREPVIVPHNPQHNPGRNLSSASDLNESMNPIDKAISGLRYSSIPYILFETQSKPNQHSRECVVQSEDGWSKRWGENVRTGSALASESIAASGYTDSSQMPEMDSDIDSSSLASSTDSSQVKNWLRTTDEVVGDNLKEGHDRSPTQSHGNEAPCSKKGHAVPQDIPLKGMARLRRISPKAISTTGLLDVEVNIIFIT